MLRRGRLRRHDLPQANWLEGFTSKRTSHLLGMCPTRHAVLAAALNQGVRAEHFYHGLMQRFGPVDHDEQRTVGIQSALDQIGQQSLELTQFR